MPWQGTRAALSAFADRSITNFNFPTRQPKPWRSILVNRLPSGQKVPVGVRSSLLLRCAACICCVLHRCMPFACSCCKEGNQ